MTRVMVAQGAGSGEGWEGFSEQNMYSLKFTLGQSQ